MKKMFFVLSSALLLMSCGGGSKSDTKVSAEMKAFMGKFDGKSASVSAALKEYGKEGLATNDMDIYNLENPKVIETAGNCYLIESKSGITKRKYNVCWEGGKISSVEDKGME